MDYQDNESNTWTPYTTPVDSNQSPIEAANSSMSMNPQNFSPVHSEEDVGHAPTNKRRLTSMVWNHFKREKIDGKDKAICNYCHKELGGETKNGTTHLHSHLKRCPAHLGQQSLVAEKNRKEGKVFDQDISRKKLARMIILHEYPLSMVDHHEFQEFTASLQPLFKVPSRNTVKSDVLNIYEYERSNTMKILEKNVSRIALTTDMWTSSNQKKGFMAITARYIDDNWKMQSRIIRFMYVPCPHTSEVLANVLFKCMLDWNLDRKLSTLTVDNCTTNDRIITNLLEKLPLSSLILDGKLFHMRCCAHILNLIVQDGLSFIKQGIEKVRDTVVHWNSSPKILELFEDAARQLSIASTKKLVLDCKTRWNSTYLMLMVALTYKKAFIRLAIRDTDFKCCPTSEEWDVAEEVCNKLSIFHDVTEKFSGNKYPTANMFFPEMCKIRIALVSWKSSSSEMIRSMAAKMIEKFEKYWFATHEVMIIAILLDPRYKMKLLEFYFTKFYGTEASLEIEKVKTLCSEVIEEYQSKVSVETTESYSKSSSFSVQETDLEFESYVNVQENDMVAKSELTHYLEEKLIPRNVEFDILTWWKTNGFKWPTLQNIARDILAIPISTVASESAFSSGGRMVTPHRSRLHSKTLEALMCAQSWLWNGIRVETCSPEMDAYCQTIDYDCDDDDEIYY